jgi:hypothetical protein
MYRPAAIAAVITLALPLPALADGVRAEPGTWWRAWNADPLVLLSLGGAGVALRPRTGPLVGEGRRGKQSASLAGGLLLRIAPIDYCRSALAPGCTQRGAIVGPHGSAHVADCRGRPALHSRLAEFRAGMGIAPAKAGMGKRLPNVRLPPRAGARAPAAVDCVGPVCRDFVGLASPGRLSGRAARSAAARRAASELFRRSCVYWRVCLDPLGSRRISPPAAVPYLFTTSLHASALGIFLALSPEAWYADYASRTGSWGLTPLEDQQLAGLIMWMPACLIYPAAAAALFGTWLAGLSATTERAKGSERFPMAEGGG